MARISSIMLKLSSCPNGSYFDSCSLSNFGIRTLRSELDTVLVSLKLLRILSTCSASITFSSFAPPSSGGKNTAAGVNGYLGAAFRPCIPLNGFGASSSGYFLNLGVGLMWKGCWMDMEGMLDGYGRDVGWI